MFSKFNLMLTDEIYNFSVHDKKYYGHIGNELYNGFESTTKNNLRTFIKDNGVIDASAMQTEWFKTVKADVFLSHSHRDVEDVKAFAGWLKDEFDLIAFIDSCVWGYCDDLLNQIDREYCKNDDENTYNYTMRNYSTSHVHMMLAVSLAKMIDSTESIIFLNTPNSVNWQDELSTLKTNNNYKTFSPWIYDELAMTSMLRVNIPDRYKRITHRDTVYEQAELKVEYDVNDYVNQMTKLYLSDLQKWQEECDGSKKERALNSLYLLKGIITENIEAMLFG